jgi:hypothetical protein
MHNVFCLYSAAVLDGPTSKTAKHRKLLVQVPCDSILCSTLLQSLPKKSKKGDLAKCLIYV